jgi:hypothetical protein
MPNYDAGHYFLTMLAPVRVDLSAAGARYSHRQTLLDTLARMPNSEVGVTTRGVSESGPFARNTMTHMARFVLIDAPPYNGRESGDTLIDKVRGLNPFTPQQADSFAAPYLLFAADFDAVDGSDAALRLFTDTLWSTMQDDLMQVFGQCYGFETVHNADDFFRYVKNCQVETTMPFNDYWRPADLEKMPADLALPVGALATVARYKTPILLALGLWVVCFILGAVLEDGAVRDAAAFIGRWGLLLVLLALAGIGAWLYSLYRAFKTNGQQAFPRGAQLPDVLKSLYLQQRFLDFVIANQGADPTALHAAFGRFAAQHAPDNETAPTQPPGIIRLAPTTPQGASA